MSLVDRCIYFYKTVRLLQAKIVSWSRLIWPTLYKEFAPDITIIFCFRQVRVYVIIVYAVVVFFAVLRKQNAYLDLGDSVGVSHHKNATPIAIHLRLVSTPSTGKFLEQTIQKPYIDRPTRYCCVFI